MHFNNNNADLQIEHYRRLNDKNFYFTVETPPHCMDRIVHMQVNCGKISGCRLNVRYCRHFVSKLFDRLQDRFINLYSLRYLFACPSSVKTDTNLIEKGLDRTYSIYLGSFQTAQSNVNLSKVLCFLTQCTSSSQYNGFSDRAIKSLKKQLLTSIEDNNKYKTLYIFCM